MPDTIIVNPEESGEETIFPSLNLSQFEQQMKAFNSYSALQKFRNETGVSPAFDFNTLGTYASGNLLDLQNYGTSKFSVDFAGKISCVGLAAGSQKITGVLDPTANQDAATKKYVDDNVPTITSKCIVFTYAGTLYAEDNFSPTIFSYNALTLTKWKAYVKTAPSGGTVTIDLNKGGALLDQLTIADGDNTGEETGLTEAIAATDLLTVDINAVTGSPEDLTIILYLE